MKIKNNPPLTVHTYSLTFIIGIFFLLLPIFAQAMFYAPGATLDPACGPTDTNCGIATSTSNQILTGIIGQIPYYASSGKILSATSTFNIFTNGNIGIGTKTPYAPLSVVGQIVGSYFAASSTKIASIFPYASTTAITVSGTSYLNTIAGTTTNSGVISGGTISNATLSSTTTNSGVISGGTISNATLSSTTTNSGVISGGTVTSHITQSCSTIVDSGNTTTSISTNPTSYPINWTKINVDTVLSDPDNAADITNSQIKVPAWAGYIQVFGHIDLPKQNNGNGWFGLHLFRNDTFTPEAYYHTQAYYPMSTSTALWGGMVSVVAISPIIPVLSSGETWQLYAEQSTGSSITVGSPGTWLTVCFYP